MTILFIILAVILLIVASLFGGYATFCYSQPIFNRPLKMMKQDNLNKIISLSIALEIISALTFSFAINWIAGLIAFIAYFFISFLVYIFYPFISFKAAGKWLESETTKNTSKLSRGSNNALTENQGEIQGKTSEGLNIENAIYDFENVLSKTIKIILSDENYISQRELRLEIIKFLKPIITDAYLKDNQLKNFLSRYAEEKISMSIPLVLDKIMFYGVMFYYIFCSNDLRHLYKNIDLDEIYKEWFNRALYPEKSLQEFGFYNLVNKEIVNQIYSECYSIEVESLIKDKSKELQAMQYSRSSFYSGILLGLVFDALIGKYYYKKKDK